MKYNRYLGRNKTTLHWGKIKNVILGWNRKTAIVFGE